MLSSQFEKSVPSANLAVQLGDQEFDFIRTVVEKNAGIVLNSTKRQLVQGRLARRIRDLGLQSFGEYCELVRNGGPEELIELINSITTNVTAFFRESHHFDVLKTLMLPESIIRNEKTRRLRIWSAGCSSGEEPYSIAMTAADFMAKLRDWDFKILATDIDSEILETAAQGIYSADRSRGLSAERQQRFFSMGTGEYAGQVRVKPALQAMIAFRTLNLMHKWPMQGPFDVIFCRNVMIYFDQSTREKLLERYAQLLADGGYLCLGHSESIQMQCTQFKLVGNTIYRKLETN
ncbi:MAG: protein-glutamate O-methyltransferase CheR [Steroidobacteraceae bacterium]